MAGPAPDAPGGVRARTTASFRGAAAVSVRSTFALGPARRRNEAFDRWRADAAAQGFPTAGPEMVLQLTDRDVRVFGTTFWAGRAGEPVGAIGLERIAAVGTDRRGAVTVLWFVLADGGVVEVESVRGGRLRRFAAAAQHLVGRG